MHQYLISLSYQPFGLRLGIALGFLALMIAIIIFTIVPIVWNFIIVPRIEERVGSRLYPSLWVDMYLFGNFFVFQVELFIFIFWKYVSLKLGKDPEKKRFNKYAFALANVNYDIKKASSLEIFMSIFTFCCYATCLLSLFLGFFLVFFFKK